MFTFGVWHNTFLKFYNKIPPLGKVITTFPNDQLMTLPELTLVEKTQAITNLSTSQF